MKWLYEGLMTHLVASAIEQSLIFGATYLVRWFSADEPLPVSNTAGRVAGVQILRDSTGAFITNAMNEFAAGMEEQQSIQLRDAMNKFAACMEERQLMELRERDTQINDLTAEVAELKLRDLHGPAQLVRFRESLHRERVEGSSATLDANQA